MKRFLLTAAVLSCVSAAQAVPATDTISTPNGPIKITAKFHASTQIEYRGKVIVIDPVMAASWTRKADFILITHSHGDHLDLPAIAKLKKRNTAFGIPLSVADTLQTIKGITEDSIDFLAPDISPFELGSAEDNLELLVEAVPMYNIVRGPEVGKKFHPRENNWNGYVLTLGGKRIYFAGDTEVTPEMKALKNIDAAFLPMNLPYTMTPQEAAAGAKAFKPKRVYPYHYRYPFNKDSGNEKSFARLMKGSKIKVVLLDWYPKAAVQKMLKPAKK
jgi:L-ascorbate metabolism protein UlaG (beta-lactamase superfamily)